MRAEQLNSSRHFAKHKSLSHRDGFDFLACAGLNLSEIILNVAKDRAVRELAPSFSPKLTAV